MAVNLIRNARVFYTSNVNTATGIVNTAGFLPSNTREIQVLDGLSFSQNTTSETVTLNEAGTTPDRGQRSFNTALDPVDFSFSTYIRPKFSTNMVKAEEAVLWNAFASATEHGFDGTTTAGAAWSETTNTAAASAVSTVAFTNSNKNQLLPFGMIIILDGASYIIDNCALDTATIDFGLDAIATIAWTGKGTKLRSGSISATTATNPVFTGITGTALGKTTDAPYLANKLSVLSLQAGISGTGTNYTAIALTGGSITLSNNLSYLTPANLGVVNQPCTYFTGTRAISGTINAYLRTGTNATGGLLSDMLTSSTSDVNPAYRLAVSVGGSSGNYIKLDMPAAVLTIPTVNTEQVISTAINFTAQGSNGTSLDIESENELSVKYYAVS